MIAGRAILRYLDDHEKEISGAGEEGQNFGRDLKGFPISGFPTGHGRRFSLPPAFHIQRRSYTEHRRCETKTDMIKREKEFAAHDE
jgi:hypothetical protein